MNGVAQIQLGSFLLVYVLLLVVLAVMKKCRINQTKLLVLASARMTLQLIAAGYALTFLFDHELSARAGIFYHLSGAFTQ